MSQINVNTIIPFSGTDVNVDGAKVSGSTLRTVKVGNDIQSVDSADSTLLGSNIFNGTTSGFGYLPQVVAIGSLMGQSTWFSVSESVFIGTEAAKVLGNGSGNTFIGFQSGIAASTSFNNTFIGNSSGSSFTSGQNNIALGNNANPATSTTNNSVTLGNSSITALRCAVTSITSLSDARDKKDVSPIDLGLEFVKELNPVKFVWDDRNEEGKHDIVDSGFIAQDLKALEDKYEAADVLKLVYDENPEKLEASYGRLIPVLVQAIKDLAAEVETLKNK
jgi:hypothetical protein